MTISKITTLVSSHWLRQQISPKATTLSSKLRVLDTSWDPAPHVDGYSLFKEGHIPSSLHFDLKEISPAREGTYHKYSIPEPEVFKDYVENLGVSNDTHVVLYDRMKYRPAFRSWFLFRLFGHNRVSVLNGGIFQWLKNGFPLAMDELKVQPGEFEPNFQRHLLRDFEAMTSNIKSKAEQVADSRGADSFSGLEPGTGHIPGSVNIHYSSLFNEDWSFKSEEELKKLFVDAGVDLNKPLVASCMTATTACSLAAAAFILGKEDVPVYNGSFTEWSKRAEPENIIQLKAEE